VTIGIIGAGRVGAALGRAFLRAGFPVVAMSSRSAAGRQRAQRLLPEVPVREPADVARASDVLLVTVVDDAILPLVTAMSAAGELRAGQYVVHTSGAHGLRVLAPVSACGAVPLAIHPAMTFPGSATDADRLPGVGFAVTAPAGHRAMAEWLVVSLGGVPIWVGESDRPLYHAGLALAANSLVAPVAAARETLAAAGIDDPAPLLGPLLHAAVDHALRLGDQALTGPVRRVDTTTLAAHLRIIEERIPQALATYRRLAVATALRAREVGTLDADQLAAVLAVLGSEST
jgi:predicted short-subunit dehydrogenase-like oxidoreductase (DUF2520 family)